MSELLRVGALIDGTGAAVLRDAEILIDAGKIKAIGPRGGVAGAEHCVSEYPSCTAVPGFIDVHTHFCYPIEDGFQKPSHRLNRVEMMVVGFRRARAWLEQGVTTARVLGTHFDLDLGLRDLVAEQPDLGPRLLAAGRMMTMTGGRRTPWDCLKDEVTGEAEARRWAREHLQEGADVVKLYCTTLLEEDVGGYLRRKIAMPDGAPDPGRWASLTAEEIQATVDEAHKVGCTVAAHASPSFGVKLALQGGVDTVEHGTEMDDECIGMFLSTGATLVPTLSVLKPGAMATMEEDDVFADFSRRQWERNGLRVGRAFDAGVRIATGTDNVIDGMSYATEIEALTEIGLSPMEAIRCATESAAACLGPFGAELGSLENGKWADIVLLGDDPLTDIRNVRKVRAVFKAGRLVVEPDGASAEETCRE